MLKPIFVFLNVLLVSAFGFAQNNTGTTYQFKTGTEKQTDAKPEFDRGFKFNTPTEANPAPVDPVTESEMETKHLYKIPLGYPKKDFYFSYNPGANSFKYTLSDVRSYSITNSSAQDLTVGFRYNPAIDTFFDINLRAYSMSVNALNDTAAGLNILKSSVNPMSLTFSAPFYCSMYETSNHRFCPGFQVGFDSFPTLNFEEGSNTDLKLANVQDMTLGLMLDYKRPTFGNSTFVANGGLSTGFGLGQAAKLGTRRNYHVNGAVGLEWNVRSIYIDIMGGADYRQALMKSSLDEWRIDSMNYYAKLGLRWEVGP